MTHMEKLKQTLAEIGIPFETTDDSEECEFHPLDTVVCVGSEAAGGKAFFFFHADGSYKDFDVISSHETPSTPGDR